MGAQDCERSIAKRRAQTIRNRVAWSISQALTGTKRPACIICVRRFGAEELNVRFQAGGRNAGPAHESAAADGSDYGIEPREVLEKLKCNGALTGYNRGIVERMNHDGACFYLK